jgi:hypothetical protein
VRPGLEGVIHDEGDGVRDLDPVGRDEVFRPDHLPAREIFANVPDVLCVLLVLMLCVFTHTTINNNNTIWGMGV